MARVYYAIALKNKKNFWCGNKLFLILPNILNDKK